MVCISADAHPKRCGKAHRKGIEKFLRICLTKIGGKDRMDRSFFISSGIRKTMQNSVTTVTVVKPWLKSCSRCGKQVFADLLDAEGMCDYCREVKSMRASITRAKKGRK